MLKELSGEELELVADLRIYGVLQDTNGHLLDLRDGAMIVTCSDGDHFYDIFRHHCEMQNGQRQVPRPHTFSWHGGALRLAPDSPANKRSGEDEILRQEITDGASLMGINTLGMDVHLVCGKAKLMGIGVFGVFDLLVKAKLAVKRENPGLTVAAFMYIAYSDGRRRRYYFSRQEWEDWCQSRRHLFI